MKFSDVRIEGRGPDDMVSLEDVEGVYLAPIGFDIIERMQQGFEKENDGPNDAAIRAIIFYGTHVLRAPDGTPIEELCDEAYIRTANLPFLNELCKRATDQLLGKEKLGNELGSQEQ